MIRIGRVKYSKSGAQTHPKYNGFTNIVALTRSTEYKELSPYFLLDEKGRNMENLWQFSKCYPKAPKSTQRYSRWNPTVIWDHPAETHVKDKDGKLTTKYFQWRKKGMNCAEPIRYPMGYTHKRDAICAYKEGEFDKPLDWIDGRINIYLPEYCRLVKKEPKFKELKKRLAAGENLLIVDVDGPHEETLDYYKNEYGVQDDFIEKDTILLDPNNLDNLRIMLHDTAHSFGHGYCLALALLDLEDEVVKPANNKSLIPKFAAIKPGVPAEAPRMTTQEVQQLLSKDNTRNNIRNTILLPKSTKKYFRYYPQLFKSDTAKTLYKRLMREIDFQQGQVTVAGKVHNERRLTAFYATSDCPNGGKYKYSGKLNTGKPFTKTLSVINDFLYRKLGKKFNSVLCNLYRDENDNIGMHSDDVSMIESYIASISLGCTRTFRIVNKKDSTEKYDLPLNSGDAIVMFGDCQRQFKHCITQPTKKELANNKYYPRINLTFRIILDQN